MKQNQVLYTSAEVRQAIIEIFSSSKGRRVAITAFVGNGAEAYLPKAKGIELVCWPKAGGTNPHALRQLLKRGVQVYFADSLHMKVYWTEDKGAVITSANLSTNALGSGNLREIGLLIPSHQLDIDKILRSVNRRVVTNKELLQLDKAHHNYHTKNKVTYRSVTNVSFSEWYESPFRPNWRIGYWDEDGNFSSISKSISKTEYGVAPQYFISCASNTYKKDDWVLTFFLKGNSPTQVRWQPIDYIAHTPKSDKAYERDNPYQAVQVWATSRYPSPPFQIDKRFREALSSAIKEFGVAEFKEKDPYKPSKRLIELIFKNF